MPKHTISFQLPEEKEELEVTHKAQDLYEFLCDFERHIVSIRDDELFRRENKISQKAADTLSEIWFQTKGDFDLIDFF